MTAAHLLWMINLALGGLTLTLARDVVHIRRIRGTDERSELTDSVAKVLGHLPDPHEILEAWEDVAVSMASDLQGDTQLLRAIVALERATDEATDRLRDLIAPQVNALNDVASFVDEGLIRPKDLATGYPELHERLLTVLPAVVPFIWFESILRGRGRWGYRVIRLNDIFFALRPVSRRRHVLGEQSIEVNGLQLCVEPAIEPVRRLWRLLVLSVRSPTISTRSKVRQQNRREDLAAALFRLGLAAPPETRHDAAIEW